MLRRNYFFFRFLVRIHSIANATFSQQYEASSISQRRVILEQRSI